VVRRRFSIVVARSWLAVEEATGLRGPSIDLIKQRRTHAHMGNVPYKLEKKEARES